MSITEPPKSLSTREVWAWYAGLASIVLKLAEDGKIELPGIMVEQYSTMREYMLESLEVPV